MDSSRSSSFRLLSLSPIELRDEVDEKNERCYTHVSALLSSASSETELHDSFNTTVAKSAAAHEEVCSGLVLVILLEPANSVRAFKILSFVNTDGMVVVINFLNQLVLEKYWKLTDSCRSQLLFLMREMIKSGTNGAENVLYNLSRNIAGGDVSQQNVNLAESLIDLVIEHRSWLEKFPTIQAAILYTFLRLILDHQNKHSLRQKEVNFCISLLRQKFTECMPIGRDLIRLLQNVARIPEFEELWRDMIQNPASLSPSFTGIHQLMQTRTPRRFLQCRLTPDMERKIVFLTSQVKFGMQKRYQDWFQRAYLSTPESQTLRCDLIRFICGIIHPSNEVLCSDIIPRWAVIGWILSSCTSNVAASNAKLSLFYDWLFYDPERDNIMNIEPAILVMFHSVRSHPVISVTLLDFLCRITSNFYPPLSVHVKKGVCAALQQILVKRVLSSLSPLFEAPKLDPELKSLIRSTFPEFCSGGEGFNSNNAAGDSSECNNASSEHEARFSDDEDQDSTKEKLKPAVTSESLNGKAADRLLTIPSQSEVVTLLDQLEEENRMFLVKMMSENDLEAKCTLMEKHIEHIISDELRPEVAVRIAAIWSFTFQSEFSKRLFPSHVDSESLEDSIGSPFFVLLRNLCESSEDDASRLPLLTLLSHLSSHFPSIGYILLYFIKVAKITDYSAYKQLAESVHNSKDVSSVLIQDLRNCQDDDLDMFCFILPDVYRAFESIALSNPQLLHLTVSCIDASQLADLIYHVSSGDLKMLKSDNLIEVIETSLEWETYEQNCLWQLITAHCFTADCFASVLSNLKYKYHSEALTGMMLALQRSEPSNTLLSQVFMRDVYEKDLFTVSILKFWFRNHEKKVADIVGTALTKTLINDNTPTKRKKQAPNKQLSEASEFILGHLNILRKHLPVNSTFFNQESIQTSLRTVQNCCTEAQRTRFCELLALAEEVDLKSNVKRRTPSKKKVKHEEGNSDAEASEDEVWVAKPSKTSSTHRAKKRKQVAAQHSDSE